MNIYKVIIFHDQSLPMNYFSHSMMHGMELNKHGKAETTEHPRKEVSMLPAQVDYWKLQETATHNRATEANEREKNRLTAEYNAEYSRSNKAQEQLKSEANQQGWVSIQETHRSNLANEDIKREQNAETQRSNLANEALKSESNAISWYNASETKRSNMAREKIQAVEASTNRELAYLKEQELDVRKDELTNKEFEAQSNRIDMWLSHGDTAYANSIRSEEKDIKKEQLELNWFNAYAGAASTAEDAINSAVNTANKAFERQARKNKTSTQNVSSAMDIINGFSNYTEGMHISANVRPLLTTTP